MADKARKLIRKAAAEIARLRGYDAAWVFNLTVVPPHFTPSVYWTLAEARSGVFRSYLDSGEVTDFRLVASRFVEGWDATGWGEGRCHMEIRDALRAQAVSRVVSANADARRAHN